MSFMKNKFIFMVIIFTGLIIGSLIGSLIELIPGDNIVKTVFITSVHPSIGVTEFNLLAFKFTFGIAFNFNLCSLIGIFVAAYIYRYY